MLQESLHTTEHLQYMAASEVLLAVPVAVALNLLQWHQADAVRRTLTQVVIALNYGAGVSTWRGQLGRGMAGGTHRIQYRCVMWKVHKQQPAIFFPLILFTYRNISFAIEGPGTGRVLSRGSNDHGRLGDGTVWQTAPVYVLTGPGYTLPISPELKVAIVPMLDASGHVWSWGITRWCIQTRNLGHSGRSHMAPGGGRCIPLRVVWWRKGTNNNNDATTDGFLNNIISLSGGDAHAVHLIMEWCGLGEAIGLQGNLAKAMEVNTITKREKGSWCQCLAATGIWWRRRTILISNCDCGRIKPVRQWCCKTVLIRAIWPKQSSGIWVQRKTLWIW